MPQTSPCEARPTHRLRLRPAVPCPARGPPLPAPVTSARRPASPSSMAALSGNPAPGPGLALLGVGAGHREANHRTASGKGRGYSNNAPSGQEQRPLRARAEGGTVEGRSPCWPWGGAFQTAHRLHRARNRLSESRSACFFLPRLLQKIDMVVPEITCATLVMDNAVLTCPKLFSPALPTGQERVVLAHSAPESLDHRINSKKTPLSTGFRLSLKAS